MLVYLPAVQNPFCFHSVASLAVRKPRRMESSTSSGIPPVIAVSPQNELLPPAGTLRVSPPIDSFN